MVKKELLTTFANTGQGFDVIDEYVGTIRAEKTKKNFRLPKKYDKKARVTFVRCEINFEDVTIDVWRMSGWLVKTITIPFSNPSMLYEIKTDDGEYYSVERKHILDFEISDRILGEK